MKTIAKSFLWFCAATLVAQIAILSLSYFRGNLSQKSLVQIIALLNGIDIPGERLKNAVIAAQETPVATRDEILAAKLQANLELDSREKSLERWQRQLQGDQFRLQTEDARLNRRLKEFETEVTAFRSGRSSETLSEVQKILEIIAPDQAKNQILRMMKDGSTADVVAIVKAMPEDKRKKILGEFTTEEEATKLGEILRELRKVQENAKNAEADDTAKNPKPTKEPPSA